MTFKQAALFRDRTSGGRPVFNVFSYENKDDTLAEVTAPEYFDRSRFPLKEGAIINALLSDGYYQLEYDMDTETANPKGAAASGLTESQSSNALSVADKKCNPLDRPVNVVLLGASITDSMVTLSSLAWSNEFKARGLKSVNVVDMATGGNGVADNLVVWEAAKATYTNTETIVIVHTLGNDVSANRPWSTLDDATKNSLYTDLYDLVVSISSNGNIPILVNTTFRNYNGTTVNNEDEGSKPFNEELLKLVADKFKELMMFGDIMFIDPYDITRNLNESILADEVHFQQKGYAILRRVWMEGIIRRISGQSPLIFDRIEDPISPAPAAPIRCKVHYGAGVNTGISNSIFNFGQLDSTANSGVIDLPTFDGYSVGSIKAEFFGGSADIGHNTNGTALDNGDTTNTLTNDGAKAAFTFTSLTTWVDHTRFSGLDPNQNYELTISSFRDTADTNRIGELTVDGGVTIYTVDASSNSQTQNQVTISGVADSNGEFLLQIRCQAGSAFAYLNAMDINPL